MLFFIVPPFYDICKHISRFLPRQFLQRRINRPPFLTIADYSYITMGVDTLVYAGQSLLCYHRNLKFLVIISNYSLTNGSLSHKIANIWKVNTVSDRTNHFLMSWGEGGGENTLGAVWDYQTRSQKESWCIAGKLDFS